MCLYERIDISSARVHVHIWGVFQLKTRIEAVSNEYRTSIEGEAKEYSSMISRFSPFGDPIYGVAYGITRQPNRFYPSASPFKRARGHR
jgi:hypothetical protein